MASDMNEPVAPPTAEVIFTSFHRFALGWRKVVTVAPEGGLFVLFIVLSVHVLSATCFMFWVFDDPLVVYIRKVAPEIVRLLRGRRSNFR